MSAEAKKSSGSRQAGEPRGGYAGRLLDIDLSTGRTEVRPLDADLVQRFVGGRGFSSWMLWEHLAGNPGALDPENVLVFATAPLTATPFPMSGRMVVAARSPATGLIGDANVGGHFAVELKQAGFDIVLIRGRAPDPVYLWLDNGRVELRDARHLWGATVYEVDQVLRQELRDQNVETAVIGPAGENRVKSACVMISRLSAAGRTGVGAVMGSKRLKAIAVRGHQDVAIADPDRLLAATKEANKLLLADPQIQMGRRDGTHFLFSFFNSVGDLPTFNYRHGQFEHADRISAAALREAKRLYRIMGCYSCVTHCHRYAVVEDGKYAGTYLKGPEFENAVAFGSQVGNANLDLLLHCNMLCNDLGLDTLSMGHFMSFSMECFEQGILSKADFDGLEPTWGNEKAMVDLIHMVAHRRGIGDLFAEGLRAAAAEIGRGAGDLAMEVKGLEECSTDKRFDYLSGLWGFTGTRGADHLRAVCSHFPDVPKPIATELFGTEAALDPQDTRGKGALVKYHEDRATTADVLGVCKFFIWWSTTWDDLQAKLRCAADAYAAVTGFQLDKGWWNQVGERVFNVERAFNVRQGLRKADDLTIPHRYLTPMPDGPAKGRAIDPHILAGLMEQYYKARGWSLASGIPAGAKLREIGLEDVARVMETLEADNADR